MRIVAALLTGLIFGLGLTISDMINPAKVLGFLDILGNWDPSLAFVMGGALIVTFIGFRIAKAKDKPVFEEKFHFPTNTTIDAKLIIGAVLFGAGWGLVGLCPGPAISALTVGGLPILYFVGAMFAGMVAFDVYSKMTR